MMKEEITMRALIYHASPLIYSLGIVPWLHTRVDGANSARQETFQAKQKG